ncbi:hypothetical protein [Clostridium beijerinckii]|uniref:hypothetical protein n=1 Tax=Clostridium beijerinckii TaxID=1520 RepID=UPI000A460529|nr:hypothetical protein [Clostridium beijerinckii]
MSMSIKTVQQDIVDVQGHLNDGDLEGAIDVFYKLKDDVNEILEILDDFMCDIKRD